MGLNVGVLSAEKLFGSSNRQPFDNIDELTTPVVPPSRIAFRILVGENGAGSLEHRSTREILRSDQLQSVRLPMKLLLESPGNLRVDIEK